MIQKDNYYTLNQIAKGKLLPWATCIATLRKWIEAYPELFVVITKGSGTGRRYFIKGSTLQTLKKISIHDYERKNKQTN